jgi:hypothetical protein
MQPKNQVRKVRLLAVTASMLLLILGAIVLAEDESPTPDWIGGWEKARALNRKQQREETLTDEEKAYLERAKELRRSRARQADPIGRAAKGKETTGLIPLTEMTEGLYKGQTGGLYGQGKNAPPDSHQKAAEKELARIEPLNAQGRASKTGKIVLISLGMSNTTQEFSFFKELADADPNKSAHVTIVDCAQGGQAASEWAYPEKASRKDRPSPWVVMDQRLEKAGVTAAQVQVVWLKQAQMNPARLGEFPAHARSLQNDTAEILRKLKERFPNLCIAYLSSRIYAGYAATPLNPEPYAYESAFSVRWLIEDQISAKADLNYDERQGEVKSPLILWGPYLWGDGIKPRKSDGLVWKREDLAGDGTHPSMSGRRKVAEMLLKFFNTHPTARF